MKARSTHLSVHGFGIATAHTTDFVIDRHNGQGIYLLMCFATPFYARTVQGVQQGEPGDCLVHDPSFRVVHGTPAGQTDGFCNDWIYIGGRQVARLLSLYRIPCNRIFSTGERALMTPFLREIQREQDAQDPYWQEAVDSAISRMILNMARARELAATGQPLSHTDKSWKRAFLELRGAIAETPQQRWTVPVMARQLHISPNRFSVLYRKFFLTSPMEDVIAKRIYLAKWFLSSSTLSVSQVADRCGFSTPFYFMRVFKKRVGQTPGEYARATRKVLLPE